MYVRSVARSRRLREDPGNHVRPARLDDLDHDLPDEVVLAGEVVADHALADVDPLGDASDRRLSEADLGDRVDRGCDDLSAPGGLYERPFRGSRPSRSRSRSRS